MPRNERSLQGLPRSLGLALAALLSAWTCGPVANLNGSPTRSRALRSRIGEQIPFSLRSAR